MLSLKRETHTAVIFIYVGFSGALVNARLLEADIVQSCLWLPNFLMSVVTLSSSLDPEEGGSTLSQDDLLLESRRPKCL